MALYHFTTQPLSRSTRSTVRAVAYRAGCQLTDRQTRETFDYRNKDVEHVELLLPKDAPSWALEVQKLMSEDRQKGVQAFVDIVEYSLLSSKQFQDQEARWAINRRNQTIREVYSCGLGYGEGLRLFKI